MKTLLILGAIGALAYLIVKRTDPNSTFGRGLTVGGVPVPDGFGNYDSTRGLLDNPSGDQSADANGATT